MDLTAHPGSTGERQLQELLGTSARAEQFYRKQLLDHLNPDMQDFVARQSMTFLSTSDAKGNCDCSFRAGPPGFVQVLDERTLAFPEYRGNGVMASAGNIRENAHLALLFIDFCHDVIGLHVNGRAELREPQHLLEGSPLAVDAHPGRKPSLWVVVQVDEAYVHCSKHIPLFMQLPKQQHWGTDDHKRKGGDFFHVAASTGS